MNHARVLVHGAQSYVGVSLTRWLSMQSSEARSLLLHWDGTAWTQREMPWPGAQLGVLDAKGDPLVFGLDPDTGRIAVRQWLDGAWQPVATDLPTRVDDSARAPSCLALNRGPAGLVLTWSSAGIVGPGLRRAARLKPGAVDWEPLGDGVANLPGQDFWLCPSVALDAKGHPVLAWSETASDAAGQWLHSDIRGARWSEETRSWTLLGEPLRAPSGSTFANYYPVIALTADDAPVVAWVPEPGEGRGLRVMRYEAAAQRWSAVGTPSGPPAGKAFGVASDLLRDSAGRLIACVKKDPVNPYSIFRQGLYCERYEGAAWAPVGPWPLASANFYLYGATRLDRMVVLDATDAFVFPGETPEQGLRLYRRSP